MSGENVAGSAGAPAIIPECVAQGGAAAMTAGQHVLAARDTSSPSAVPCRDASGPPRIGVVVCHCGANIAGVVDVQQLAREAAALPGVVHADHISFACADVAQRALERGLDNVQEMIKKRTTKTVQGSIIAIEPPAPPVWTPPPW